MDKRRPMTIPKKINGHVFHLENKVYYHVQNLERSKERSKVDITRRQIEIERLNDIIGEFEIKNKG